jgi:hypothetical protein
MSTTANPYTTLEEMFLSLLQQHIDASMIEQTLVDQGTILGNQVVIKNMLTKLLAAQVRAKAVIDQTAADMLSIKVFLGLPDVRIVATQKDLDNLGAKLLGDTTTAQKFDQTIVAEEPAPALIPEAPPTKTS